MIYLMLIVVELAIAALLRQDEQTAYLMYLLSSSLK
jgi:hypothetical protein